MIVYVGATPRARLVKDDAPQKRILGMDADDRAIPALFTRDASSLQYPVSKIEG